MLSSRCTWRFALLVFIATVVSCDSGPMAPPFSGTFELTLVNGRPLPAPLSLGGANLVVHSGELVIGNGRYIRRSAVSREDDRGEITVVINEDSGSAVLWPNSRGISLIVVDDYQGDSSDTRTSLEVLESGSRLRTVWSSHPLVMEYRRR